jgi:hypothetical protein
MLSSGPSKLVETDVVVPDLRPVAGLVTFELHYVHVVRLYLLSGSRHRSTVCSVGTSEHGVRGYVWRSSSTANERISYLPSGVGTSRPFIQSEPLDADKERKVEA